MVRFVVTDCCGFWWGGEGDVLGCTWLPLAFLLPLPHVGIHPNTLGDPACR